MSLLGSPFFFSSGAAGGNFYSYEIDQSLRFEPADNPYMAQTFSSSGGTIFTFSCWVKIADQKTSRCLLQGYSNSSNFSQIILYGGAAATDGYIGMYSATGGTVRLFAYTQALQRDPSAWYHIVIKFNGTSGSEEFKIYVNGENQDLTVSTALTAHQSLIGNSNAHYFGNNFNLSLDMDGYIAETNFIDGTALDANSFGETKAGVWIPKQYSGSYGTNGFYLNFSDSSSLGTDSSGQGNNMTSVSGVTATDQVPDSPTNNFCTYNVLDRSTSGQSNQFLTQGNLNLADYLSTEAAMAIGGTMVMRSGKWYFECCRIAAVNASYWGIIREDIFVGQSSIGNTGLSAGEYGYSLDSTGYRRVNGVGTSSFGSTYAQDDVFQCAYDADTGKVWFGKNNTWQGSGDPANGTNEAATVDSPSEYGYKIWTRVIGNAFSYEQSTLNCGQDSTFADQITAGGNADGNGIGDFKYAPPSGFLALCSANLPDPGIDPAQDEEPADYFNTVTYSGNNTQLSVTGVGFQPDWVWIKKRNGVSSHALQDSVRGSFRYLVSNSSAVENTDSGNDWFRSFDSDGFTVSKTTTGGTATTEWNNSGDTYASWNWLAGGSASSNSNGSITSSVSANTKAGFSIVTYTGNATAGATVGHGLSSTLEMYIVKSRSLATSWVTYHKDMASSPEDGYLVLNGTDAFFDTVVWNDTAPTNSVFSLGGTGYSSNNSGATYVAYCFHSVDGYSKVGSFTGNGSTDGPFVYTGFRPAWLMLKRTNSTSNWSILDSQRNTFNVVTGYIDANVSSAEATNFNWADFTSNGFKFRGTNSTWNASGSNYIFLCFAEQPFKYSNAR